MLKKAIDWIHANTLPQQGVRVTSSRNECYPEVSGYYIPTLLEIGEEKLAIQYATWLASIQREDGRICAPGTDEGFVFDTGQVIRGWVSIVDRMPALEKHLLKACAWIMETADPATGRLMVPKSCWELGSRGYVNEGIHLYCLGPLAQAGELLGCKSFTKFALKSREYYLKNVSLTDFTQPNALSHFYAYIQEALVELGCADEARKGMKSVMPFRDPRGFIPAYHDVPWVCSTGMAQMAKVWYYLGDYQLADTTLAATKSLQNDSGGFYGSYGPRSEYFPTEEIAWAVKYFIDAYQMQIAAHFDQTVGIFPDQIDPEDGRMKAVLKAVGDISGKRILDAGCGKGRFVRCLKDKYPDANYSAFDVSPEMLRYVPTGVDTKVGSLLDVPYAAESFDVVICIEALEHAVQIPEAVAELKRVLAPGGKLVVIDKNTDRLGSMELPEWEQWFDREGLQNILEQAGLEAGYFDVSPTRNEFDAGLFSCWIGQVREKIKVSPRAATGKTSPEELSIDFYHIDKVEAASFLPVWRQLTKLGVNARLVLAPDGVNTASRGWFNFEETCEFYDSLNVPYSLEPDYDCDLAITTQYANTLEPYHNQKARMMYGATMFGGNFSLKKEACDGFDALFVHGQYFVDQLASFYPEDRLIIVGNPKFDSFFKSADRANYLREKLTSGTDKPIISYLPTWDQASSLDQFLPAVSKLQDMATVIIKPHHCTIRFEPARVKVLNESGCLLVGEPMDQIDLYLASDLVLSDVRSGGLYDAVSLNIPTIGLDPHPELTKKKLDPLVHKATAVCPYPESLEGLARGQLAVDAYSSGRAEVAGNLLSYGDGTASIRCAAEMVNYLLQSS